MTKKTTKKIIVTRFDAADYLDSEEMIAKYLASALEDSNSDVFLSALGDVAKARVAKIAKDAGLSRESLYKSPRAERETALQNGA